MPSIKYMPAWIKVSSAALVILAPALWMTLQVMRTQTVRCSVCIEFKGRRDCRKAEAPTKEECQRTGTDNACALISAGMTEVIACGNTPPSEMKFYE